ncbi:Translocon-associated protein, delta subunit precursor (TRAP-delta) [Popillia japonica]|uniref:Translocon-associated protein subunit delta n=1 Tax=Popillia japonica TaxID=7064 RepID=A0AAW1JDI8_POPJA
MVFSILLSNGICEKCVEPRVVWKQTITKDASSLLKNNACIVELEVTCYAGKVTKLYADIEGYIKPIPSIGENLFQISWIEDSLIPRPPTNKLIRIFDEEGFFTITKRRQLRRDTDNVEELFRLSVDIPGKFTKSWLKCELVAIVAAVLIAYVAFNLKRRLLL